MEFSSSQAGTSSSALPEELHEKLTYTYYTHSIDPTSFRGAGLQRLRYKTDDFRYEIQVDALALADASHAVGALSVISEDHVFANGYDSTSRGALLDVDARCVNLIKEREPVRRAMRQNNGKTQT